MFFRIKKLLSVANKTLAFFPLFFAIATFPLGCFADATANNPVSQSRDEAPADGTGAAPLRLSLPENSSAEAQADDDFEEKRPDYAGLREDSYYFFGYQFFVIGVLYISPQSVSGWSPEQKKNFTVEKYYNNVTDIIWDHDKFYINFLLHPYWGMAYYVRARDRGVSETGSFWYSVLLSTMWEFGVEAMFEEVSIQDLFITPIVGSVVGKYVDNYRDGVKQKPVKTGMDNFMLGVTDPLGATNRWVQGMLGQNANVSFSYSVFHKPYNDAYPEQTLVGRDYERNRPFRLSPAIGITFNYQL
jgi:hypothetical protein